ncbi:MAG: putative transporter, ATPase and permease component [Alphaproteobacteria bacterium]|nr:putative transporter, ATPase and permease component [Alphaproteobacteria bacterium]
MKTLPATLLEKPQLSRFIWETFLRYRKWAFVILLLRCISKLDQITWPFFVKLMTDNLISVQQTHQIDWQRTLWIILLGFVGWYGNDIADITSNILSGPRIARIRAEIRLLVLNDIYRQSQRFFHDRFAGSISTSLRDLSETVSDILNEILYQFIPTFLLFLTLCSIFFHLHIGYTLLMFAWMSLQVTLVYLTKRNAQKKSRDYGDNRSELIGKLIDSMSNHMSISSFTAHANEHDYIRDAEVEVIKKRVDVVNYTQKIFLTTATVEALFIFGGFLSLYLYLFSKGQATVGDFMFLLSGIGGFMRTVKEISNRMFWLYEQIGIGQEAIRKIIVPKIIEDKEDAQELKITEAKIEVQKLAFAYMPDKPVLQDVSFTMQSGEKIGLVGYSGAGKTTFVNLLLRFYELTQGRILIDGQDIKEVTQESLRRQIALIPQDTSLFHRSLRDNIRIARPEADEEEIVTAAKMAGAHDFIMAQQNQYETLVGERGVKLSGGQRQRIAIARAFLKAAPILILDEATSALDSLTEQGIQDALDLVMSGRTTLVIAHRLSTLRRMDRVLVFDKGRIIEDGSHDALLARNGTYAKMWAMQAGGFLPEKEEAVLSESL